jgi:prepilin-type N-terminal cleavage/methylation domain-containing protein
MIRRGFTVVELIITITIMGILLLLTVVNVNASQVSARDNERVGDVEAIQANLESVYATGAQGNDVPSTITNLLTNPSFETNTTGWVSSCGATSITRVTTDQYLGVASVRINTSGADQCMYYGSPYIVTTVGRTYTMSAWVKGSGTGQLSIGSHPGGATVALSPVVVLSDTWQRISVTGTTTSGMVDVYPVFWQRSAGSNSLYVDAAMATETSYLSNYGDGSTTGWVWTGASDASTSTGSAVTHGSQGFYPGTSLTVSPFLSAYLSDIDTKSFQAPGQTDVYATFITATNATQTTTGVLPQPTINQYVYQPIDASGNLCTNSADCRKYNIYYRLEKDNTVYMVTSKNQ